MLILVFQENLTCFSNVKSITVYRLELIHQVGEFILSNIFDGIEQVVVRASERLDWDVYTVCFSMGLVATDESFCGG